MSFLKHELDEKEANRFAEIFEVPLPIQSFLWRQTNPFLRSNLGKLHQASCTSFEHIIVKSKLQGLPPSLSRAIKSISRSRLIEACLPHVLHCAAVLTERSLSDVHDVRDGTVEQLLCILHWIFGEDSDKICNKSSLVRHWQIGIDEVILFIFLFAPIVDKLKASTLGLCIKGAPKIWTKMKKYQQPNLPMFETLLTEIESNISSENYDSKFTSKQTGNSNTSIWIKASVCDVAVVRCLLNSQWNEDGIIWGLKYFRERLKSPKCCDKATTPTDDDSTLLTTRKPNQKVKVKLPCKETAKEERIRKKLRKVGETSETLSFQNAIPRLKKAFSLKGRKSFDFTSSFRRLAFPSTRVNQASSSRTKTVNENYENLSTSQRLATENTVNCVSGNVTQEDFNEASQNSSTNRPTSLLLDGITFTSASATDGTTDDNISGRDLNISSYIDNDGYFHFIVIVSMLEKVLNRVLSVETVEVCLHIIENLHSFVKNETTKIDKNNIEAFIKVIFDFSYVLSCGHKCGQLTESKTIVEEINSSFQQQTHSILSELFLKYHEVCVKYLIYVIDNMSVRYVLHFLHSVLSYCRTDADSCEVRDFPDFPVNKKMDSLNNVIVKTTFSNFVDRWIECQDILFLKENKDILRETRNFIQFVRLNHPLVFNEKLLTLLLVPCKKRKVWVKDQKKKSKSLKTAHTATTESGSNFYNRLRRGAVDMPFSPLLSRTQSDKCYMKKKKSFHTRRSADLDKALELRYRETSKCLSYNLDRFSDEVDFSDAEKRNSRGGISIFDRISIRNIFKAKPTNELNFELTQPKFISRVKGSLNMNDKDSVSRTSSKHSTATVLDDLSFKIKKFSSKQDDFVVDPNDIYKGVAILDFLMEMCPPGTVPDPIILSSTITLESPIVSRATLITQVACFIRRCSDGDWPYWMLVASKWPNSASGKGQFDRIRYLSAKLFHQLAVQLSKQLDRLKIISDQKELSKSFSFLPQEETECTIVSVEYQEDYLKDILVNPDGKSCPVELQLAVVNLILEITCFICDALPNIPKSTNNQEHDKETLSHHNTGQSDNTQKRNQKLSHQGISPSGQTSIIIENSADLTKHSLSTRDLQETKKQKTDDNECKQNRTTGNALLVPPTGPGGLTIDSSIVGSFSSYSVASAFSEYATSTREVETIPKPSHASSPNTKLVSVSWEKNLPWLQVMFRFAQDLNVACSHINPCHQKCSNRNSRTSIKLMTTMYAMFSMAVKPPNLRRCDRHDSKHLHKFSTQRLINMLCYSKAKQYSLIEGPLATLLRAVCAIPHKLLVELQELCWKILLSNSNENLEITGALFLLCAAKVPEVTYKTISSDLKSVNPSVRDKALQKVQFLWQCRNKVWNNAEAAARKEFKIPNPTFSFTLPPTSLGLRRLIMCDPPWLPHIIYINDLIAQNESSVQNSALLATHTLSHYRERQKKELLERDSDERLKARRAFFITDIPTVMKVCHDIRRKVLTEETEEGEVPVTSRRFSIRQPSEASCIGNESAHKDAQHQVHCRSSMFGRNTLCDHNSQENVLKSDHPAATGNGAGSVISSASIYGYPVFPSSIAGCIPIVIDLMTDVDLSSRRVQVGEVAKGILSTCIKEDASLFLRCIIDKLTSKQTYSKVLIQLRKLINHMSIIAPSVASTLISHLIEAILRFSHTSNSDYMIAEFVSIIESLLPHVASIDMKTMKQALNKEKIETQVFITAGFPGIKKLTVWPLHDYYIPNQIEVTDQSNFDSILREVLSIYGIDEDINHYQIIDRRSQQPLCRHCYVRDFYQFSKETVPELILVKNDPVKSTLNISNRVVKLKLNEISRLRMTCTALHHRNSDVDQQLNASFVLDELKKLWSFPRKAIDAELFLFDSKYKREIRALDVMQKFYWLDLISTVFLTLSKDYSWERHDLKSFISVWCGAIILHCEQAPLLSKLSSTLIDVVAHFSQSFMMHGYSLILPTMLRVYSKYCHNKMTRSCLELIFRQMQRIHQKPFILELFASAAPLLSEYYLCDASNDGNNTNGDSLAPKNFFQMLLSLQKSSELDQLDVMRSVVANKPLVTDVMCADGDDENSSFDQIFTLAVTVIAYQPESPRTLQMLTVMNNILPCYFDQLQIRHNLSNSSNGETAAIQLRKMALNFRSLLATVEVFTRNFSSFVIQSHSQQQQTSDSQQATSRQSMKSVERDLEAGETVVDSDKLTLQAVEDFLAPRDILLQLCINFFVNAVFRLRGVCCGTSEMIYNFKSHIRLSEIAQSVLKLLTDEEMPFITVGLVMYVKYYLPLIDWTDQNYRPALFAVLKRLDRFFMKLSKKPHLRKEIDSQAIEMILTGIQDLLSRQPVVAHIPHLKTFVNTCVNMQASLNFIFKPSENLHYHQNIHPDYQCLSPSLTPKVIKLAILQLEALRSENYNFENLMQATLNSATLEEYMLNFIVPICFSCASETLIFPKTLESEAKVKWNLPITVNDAHAIMTLCFNGIQGKHKKRAVDISQLLTATYPISKRNEFLTQRIMFLSLRTTLAAFSDRFYGCWPQIAHSIREIALKTLGGSAIWNFLIFVMQYKTPLIIHLKPFVQNKFIKRNVETSEEADLKHHLEEILRIRKHKPLMFSHLSKQFASEAKQLSLLLTSSLLTSVKPSPGVSRVRFGSSRRSPNSVLSRVGSFRKSNSSISKEERRYVEREAALAEEEDKQEKQKSLCSPLLQRRHSSKRTYNNSHRLSRLTSRSFRLNKTTSIKYRTASTYNMNKTPPSKRRSSIPNIKIEQYEDLEVTGVEDSTNCKAPSISSLKYVNVSGSCSINEAYDTASEKNRETKPFLTSNDDN